ncbi:telomerase inhibitor/ribosome biogenesis protein PXR1 [Aspergillus stella-maris]|uniref:telomerase inhibitor/ribosome biogenesis protein PXR1 n=1 Tax=Aspergillus stella-maris TaxID=1810926 RepID=UPI003CCDA5A6
MGLAAPRKKTKISHDPNNTNWSRSTSGFGHKILSSQGWTPGSFLGAQNAAHADMFTAASASHIRVIVKDDTLGLGARSKRNPLDEPTGLDAFKGLLGRLNGRSDAELQADQRKRDDVKLARYAATKWQAVRFISGGLLAQEKDESTKEDRPPVAKSSTRSSDHETNGVKVFDTDQFESATGQSSRDEGSEKKASKKEKKEKKSKKERKEKKEKKRKRPDQQEDSDGSSSGEKSSGQDAKQSDRSTLDSGTSTKTRHPLGRNMIRGRYIAQKRKALMDEKSLNEIFMIKS